MNPIPVTLLSGFLGSGKTTLLNQIIKTNQSDQIFVIMNEFGEISIDSQLLYEIDETQVFQLNNGCMCCVANNEMKSTFAKIMTLIDQQQIQIDQIMIELSGLANPEPVIQTITETPFLCDYFYLDSVYTLIDSQNGAHQIDEYEELTSQILYADKLLFTKNHPNDLDKLVEIIRQINPFVPMETVELNSQTAKHYLHQNLFGQKPVEFDAHLNQWLENYHQHADANGHHHHHSDLTSFAIEVEEGLTATQVEQWLEYLINRYGKDLVRYKGFIAVESFEHQLIVQGVHQWFQLDRGRLWEPEEPRVSRMVFIGRQLDPDHIKQTLLDPTLIEVK